MRRHIQKEFSQEEHLAYLKQGKCCLDRIPSRLRTLEMCKIAILRNISDIRFVPKQIDCTDFCIKVVKQYIKTNQRAPGILYHAPDHLKSEELCMLLFSQDKWNLKGTPRQFITYQMCVDAIKECGTILKYVPEEFKTQKLCIEAVKQKPHALQYVPKELKTPELCLLAIKQHAYCMQHIPEELKTEEMFEMAVKQNLKYFSQIKNPSQNIINLYELLTL
jgi:hypothetical protein